MLLACSAPFGAPGNHYALCPGKRQKILFASGRFDEKDRKDRKDRKDDKDGKDDKDEKDNRDNRDGEDVSGNSIEQRIADLLERYFH